MHQLLLVLEVIAAAGLLSFQPDVSLLYLEFYNNLGFFFFQISVNLLMNINIENLIHVYIYYEAYSS